MSRFRFALLLALLSALPSAAMAQIPSTPIVDIDGNSYLTVKIGDQVWMAQNLLTTRYANGDAIPMVTDPTLWATSQTGARSIYANDPTNLAFGLGMLYNGGAVLDPRGVCPDGWAVPNAAQWTRLIETIGGLDNAGSAMKWPDGWPTDPTAVGASAFGALPAGLRNETGAFENAGAFTGFWSSTAGSAPFTLSGVGLVIDSTQVFVEQAPVTYGFSIRCLERRIVVKLNEPGGNVENKTAGLSGSLVDDGGYAITERGFVWDRQSNPTLEQNLGRHVDGGTALGAFSHTVTDLTLNETYWVRSYAVTASDTVYSTVRSFLLEEVDPGDGGGGGGGGFNTAFVEDVDGNRYAIDRIGGRYWMRTNLRTTRFRDSTPITEAPTPQALDEAAAPAHGDPGTGRTEDGRFYNAAAVLSEQGLCPQGWHVPSEAEWMSMADRFGGEFEAGTYLKDPYGRWVGETPDARSVGSGLDANPVGRWSGEAIGAGFHAYFWSSTPAANGLVYHQLTSGDPRLRHGVANAANGLSVRCVSDPVFEVTAEASRLQPTSPDTARLIVTAATPGQPAIEQVGIVWSAPTGSGSVDPRLDAADGSRVVSTDSAGVLELPIDLLLSDGTALAVYVKAAGGAVAYSRTLTFTSQSSGRSSVDAGAGLVPVRTVYNPYRKTLDEWMEQDLQTGTFRDGTPLQPEDFTDTPQGRLYRWSAASDPRGLCPEGWALPDWNDWRAVLALDGPVRMVPRLAEFTDSKAIWSIESNDDTPFDAAHLRSRNADYATVLHESATNRAGFDLRPTAGDRSGLYLSRTPYDEQTLHVWELPAEGADVFVHARDVSGYFRVRCKAEQTLPPGQTDLVFSDVSGDYEYGQPIFHSMGLRTILSGDLANVTQSGLLVAPGTFGGDLTIDTHGPGLSVVPAASGAINALVETSPGTYFARFYASTADTTVYSATVDFTIARHPVARLADAVADSSGSLTTSLMLNDFDPYTEWFGSGAPDSPQAQTLHRNAITAFQFRLPLPDSARFDSISRQGTLTGDVEGQLFTHVNADTNGARTLTVAFASSNPLPDSPYAEQPLLNLHLTMTASQRADTVAPREVHLNSFPLTHVVPGVLRTLDLNLQATGDVDGDGAVRAYDASLVLQAVVGKDPLPELDPIPWEPQRVTAADVDGNGEIQAMDASHILRYLVGLITDWPTPGAPAKAADPTVSVSFTGNALLVLVSSPGGSHALEVTLPAIEGVVYGPPTLPDHEGASAHHAAPDGSLAVALASSSPATERAVRVPVSFTDAFTGAHPDGSARLEAAYVVDTRKGGLSVTISPDGTAVSTQDASPLPERYELRANRPNPFNPATRIEFALPEAADIRLEVFDATGRRVAVLSQGMRPAGVHAVTFDASALSSGLYLYRITSAAFTATRTMVLVK